MMRPPYQLLVTHLVAVQPPADYTACAGFLYAIRSDGALFTCVVERVGDVSPWRELPRVPGTEPLPAGEPTAGRADEPEEPGFPAALSYDSVYDALQAAHRPASRRSAPLDDPAAVTMPDPVLLLEQLHRLDDDSRRELFVDLGLITPVDLDELEPQTIDVAELDAAITTRALRNAFDAGRLPDVARATARLFAARADKGGNS